MYYLVHRNQLYVSALFMAIFRLIMRNLISSYTRFACVVYIYIYIQGVTGGKDQTSGGCSLC